MNNVNFQCVAITALGACTSLGDIVTAAAAWRSGLTRPRVLSDISVQDDESVDAPEYVGHPAADFTEGFEAAGRWVLLGAAALQDMVRWHPLRTAMFQDATLLFALPLLAPQPAEDADEADAFLELETEYRNVLLPRIGELTGTAIALCDSEYTFGGRIGLFRAIRDAIEKLQAGSCRRCIVAAIDSRLSLETLGELLESGQLKGAGNSVGLEPGEAAVFLCLEPVSPGQVNSSNVLLHVPFMVREPLHKQRTRPTGQGLSEVIAQAMSGTIAAAGKGEVYIDLSGETLRAEMWSLAVARLGSSYGVRDWPVRAPAESFGDTGAASGALSIALACRAYTRGYANSHRALVLCATEAGECAATLVVRGAE